MPRQYFVFQWHITEACDQRCKHCYIYALGSKAEFSMASLDDMLTVLENVREFCRKADRVPYLYITGGDPILHPQFWTLARILKVAQIRWCILGNPFHLTAGACRKLADCGCVKYQLSLDGLRETHDFIRQEGSYDATLAAIPLIREAGMQVAVMSTVSKLNVHEIPDLAEVCSDNLVDVFAFSRYCPDADDRDSCCSPLEYRAMLDACWHRFEELRAREGNQTWFSLKDHLWTLYRYERGLFDPDDRAKYPDDNRVYDGCNCGNCHFTILSDGSCYACRRMESKVGNVLEDDLYDLFRGPSMDAYRRYEDFEKCSRCELLRFCRGCPAVAAGYHGSMYAPDPQCWKEVV